MELTYDILFSLLGWFRIALNSQSMKQVNRESKIISMQNINNRKHYEKTFFFIVSDFP